VVAINPYRVLEGYYSQELMDFYALEHEAGEVIPPHTFEIAVRAFRGCCRDNENQAIIISGESGSGKTETTKKCMEMFASIANSHNRGSGGNDNMAERILASNPILEAFGNACTVKNNNSSRFGKWVEISFDGNRLGSCRVHSYLLEKVHPAVALVLALLPTPAH
jgi:myosin heavy subunit